jgi:hypothetical protein
MKPTQISIVLFGRDAHLLETRKWVLQSLGYRVLTVGRVSELRNIPSTPPVALLVLCPTPFQLASALSARLGPPNDGPR